MTKFELMQMHAERRMLDLQYDLSPVQLGARGDPWAIICECKLLNLTSIAQVRPLLPQFFALARIPAMLLSGVIGEVTELLRPLGLCVKRADSLRACAEQWVSGKWLTPSDLYGVGPYAVDALRMFAFLDYTRAPADSKLLAYWESVHAR